MNKLILAFWFSVTLFSLVSLSETSQNSAEMASPEQSARSRISSDAMAGPSASGILKNSGVSTINLVFATTCYGVALALGLLTLFLLYRSRSLMKTDPSKGKKLFFTSLALCIAVIVLLTLPSLFFLSPRFPGNFDMRAT